MEVDERVKKKDSPEIELPDYLSLSLVARITVRYSIVMAVSSASLMEMWAQWTGEINTVTESLPCTLYKMTFSCQVF